MLAGGRHRFDATVAVVAVVLASWYTIAVMRSSLLAAQLDSLKRYVETGQASGPAKP